MPKPKIGFIGLGIMGKPMSKNLIKAGYSLTVFDVVPGPMQELKEAGAAVAGSSKEAAQVSEVIITMLPDGPDVEKAVLGENGILEGARAGTILIDMSSIAPGVAQRVGAEVAKKGVEMLDAPVSGGEPGAVAGTLAIMVGGKKEIFDRCVDILKVMGSSVTLVGAIGAGNTVKLANQIIVGANIEALAEALVLATKAGVDPQLVFEAIKGGLAGSTVMNAKAPMMISRNFNPGFRLRLHQKDLKNALDTGRDLGVPLPVTGIVQSMIVALVNDGKGNYDHSGILTFLEDMAKVEVKAQ
jgi:2-hydroxy-3-oxopropionate reductase